LLDAAVADAAAASDAADASASVLAGPPGLYADERCELLAQGIRPYHPRYELWADGADKERFAYLPEGATIDGSDADSWTYPTGTRLYKTFSSAGTKLETRIIEKTGAGRGPDAWSFQVYAWREDQRSVQQVGQEGRLNVLGTNHDIPSVLQCRGCHGAAAQDAVNGFSAIQLNHQGDGVTLAGLLEHGVLSSPLDAALLDAAEIAGDEAAREVLGYLHANCGNCHGGPSPRASMTLRASVGQAQLTSSTVYLSVVGKPLQRWTGRLQANGEPYMLRMAPGAGVASGVVARMSTRSAGEQMPPAGTELVDTAGLTQITAWIDTLQPDVQLPDGP
jgi:hypothetical protein